MALQTKTVSTGDYGYQSWSNGYKIALTLTEESISAQDNTSVVSYLFTISNTTNNRFYSDGYSWDISIAEKVIHIKDFDFYVYPYNVTQIIVSGQVTVVHDSDGRLEMPFSVSIPDTQRWTNYGPPAMAISGTWALTDIPRGSTIGATDANIGAVAMIAIRKKEDAFTHSVAYAFGGLTGYITAEGSASQKEVRFGETSVPFAVPTAFYEQIPDVPSGICTLTCRTYSGNAAIGQPQTCRFAVAASPAMCAPEVSGTVTDTNQKTVALTGDSSVLVRHYSTALCKISAKAKCAAQITGKRINGVAVEETNRTIANVETGSFLFEATDSRGYTANVTVTAKVVDYIKPTANTTCNRTDPTSGRAILRIKGDCYTGSFGAQQNALTVKYRVGSGSYVTVTPTITGNSYTATATISNLDYTQSHTVEIVVSDRLSSVTKTAMVNQGIPVFDWGKSDFQFHVPVSAPNINFRGDCADANAAYLPGVYFLNSGSANAPNTNGVLLVFNCTEKADASAPILQIGVNWNGTQRKMRMIWWGNVQAWHDL